MSDVSTDDDVVPDPPAPEVLSFSCPRCRSRVDEAFYGPCASCRDQLKLTYTRRARDVVAEEYVPKMNVTPNAVALKDD